MARARLTEFDLSYHAAGLPDRDTYLTVVSACLNDVLPGDLIGWKNVDLANPWVKVWFNDATANCTSHISIVAEHPIVAHQLAHPGSEPVLRVSDCVSDRMFRLSRAYRALFVPQDTRYQLTIATNGDDAAVSSWLIKRSIRDFTEAELRHARRLQPLLALLDTIYLSSPIRRADGAHLDEARKRVRLTARELDILTLLADGLSAQQIARLRRISVRTVQKHLENIYDKLDCHDRLLAINKARQLGLLTPSDPASLDRESHGVRTSD
jgi:DNA-binding CsgD family transcriptional regulator